MKSRLGPLLVAFAAWAVVVVAAPAASQTGSADLGLTKTGPGSVTVGSDVAYQLTVTNAGPEQATGVTVTDELPPGMVFAGASTTKGTCTGSSTVVCTIGSLAAGESAEVTITATPTVAGDAANQASVSSGNVDPVPTNNSASASTDVTGSSCSVIGTQGDDTLVGGPTADVICGLGGADDIDAGGGANTVYGGSGGDVLSAGSAGDLLDGGAGSDTVSYADATSGVKVDLKSDSASGWGPDTVPRIERAVGSDQNDQLRGSAGANVLTGGAGVDLLFGRDGPDDLAGGDGDDYLDGGGGADDLDGGSGMDACVSGTRTSCLSTSPSDGDDTRGKLDVKKVKTSFGQKPTWRVISRSTWGLTDMWDEGFVLVYLDTKGSAAPDYYAMARSDGSKLRGRLYAIKGGIDTFKSTVTATRPNARTVRIAVSLGKVVVGPSRAFYRWSVQTLAIGPCKKVCFDFVPGGNGLVQPL